VGTRSNARSAWQQAALHWQTYFAHVHGRLPGKTLSEDYATLREIVVWQCFGKADAALSMIEAIVDAPIPGDRLFQRRAAYRAWSDAGRPKRYTKPSARVMREIRRSIALGAERAA
jgi:hypothetical protein